MRSYLAKLCGFIGLYVAGWTIAAAAPGYQYSIVGNPGDVVTPTSGLLVLQGGGTDVDENFVRMGAHAGGGDFVVIRASGTLHLRSVLVRTPSPPSSSRTTMQCSTRS